MLRNLALFLLLFHNYFALAQSQLPQVSTGKIERHVVSDTSTGVQRTIDVWLPPAYDTSIKHAVFYLHDGQMLFDSSATWNKQEWKIDETAGQLLEAGKIIPCIVVGIWNAGSARHAEYFPQKPFESLPKMTSDSIIHAKRPGGTSVFNDHEIYSDDYLKFLTGTIKPFIDENYSTNRDRQHTFVGGSSMGGLISMYAICEYPDIIGGAACLSTHWPGIFETDSNPIPEAFLNYLQQKAPNPSTHKLYFDRGTETLDAWYGKYQLQADKLLQEKGYNPTNFRSLEFKGADHSEKAWSARMAIPFEFLMGTE